MLLTPVRIANQLKCWINYALSLFGIVHISHYPAFLTIEPANICQLACPECPVGMAKKHSAEDACVPPAGADSVGDDTAVGQRSAAPRTPFPDFPLSLLSDCLARAHTVQFYFQGEPLLNPRLPEMIREAAQRGCYTVVSTNAQALDRAMARRLVTSGLHRIIVSMDGLTQASYEAYRQGGSVEKAKNALRYLHEEREAARRQRLVSGNRPVIELQCLLLRSNESERSLFRKTYRRLGADRLSFKTAQFYDYEHGNPLMPARGRDRRYEQCADGTYRLKRTPLRRLWQRLTGVSPCYRLWAGCVLTTNGDVLPCCYDKQHTCAYGNILTPSGTDTCANTGNPLVSVFRSRTANRFRQTAIRSPFRHAPEMCQNCWH
ncbi:MAG: radical SAM/SPASM domain-containing protein [Paludibacteraceae bacterium]